MKKIVIKYKYQLQLILIVTAGFLLRLYRLGRESIWADEGFSLVTAADETIAGVIKDIIAHDLHYTIFLHYRIHLFGNFEFSIRFPSVLFAVISMLIIYKIGALLFTRQAGILSAFFIAAAEFHIHYSREVRGYMLIVMLTLLTFYFLIKLLKEFKSVWVLLYIFLSIFAVYTHIYSILPLITYIFCNTYQDKKNSLFLYGQQSSLQFLSVLFQK